MIDLIAKVKNTKSVFVSLVTSILEGLRTSNEAVALNEKSANGLESVVELSIERFFVSID